MIVLLCIIVVVALVSTYDFFTTRNWQQVTSTARNETVFKNRNRAYGAYVIRRDYDKRIALILLGLVGGVGALYAASLGFREPEKVAVKTPEMIDVEYELNLEKEKEDVIAEPKQETASNPAPAAQTYRFIPLEVIDDPTPTPLPDPKGDPGSFTTPPGTPGDPWTPPSTTPPGTGTDPLPPTPTTPATIVDEEAEYPGGIPAMKKFLAENINYPEMPAQLGIEGKCYLRFVVGKDGDISNVVVQRGVPDCPECDKEAKRVIFKMPKWKPGKINGRPVASYFNIPVKFELQH